MIAEFISKQTLLGVPKSNILGMLHVFAKLNHAKKMVRFWRFFCVEFESQHWDVFWKYSYWRFGALWVCSSSNFPDLQIMSSGIKCGETFISYTVFLMSWPIALTPTCAFIPLLPSPKWLASFHAQAEPLSQLIQPTHRGNEWHLGISSGFCASITFNWAVIFCQQSCEQWNGCPKYQWFLYINGIGYIPSIKGTRRPFKWTFGIFEYLEMIRCEYSTENEVRMRRRKKVLET